MRPRELMAGSLLIASVLLSPPSWPPWSGCDDQRCSSEILADFGAAGESMRSAGRSNDVQAALARSGVPIAATVGV